MHACRRLLILTPTAQHLPDSCQFRSHAIQCEYNWCLLFSMSKFGVVHCVQTLFFKLLCHHTYKTHGKVAGVGSIQHRYHHAPKLPAWGTINTNATYYIPTPTRLDQQVLQHQCQYILTPTRLDQQLSPIYMQHQCQYIPTPTRLDQQVPV